MLIFYSRGFFTAETLLNDYRCTATAGSCGIRGAKIKKKLKLTKSLACARTLAISRPLWRLPNCLQQNYVYLTKIQLLQPLNILQCLQSMLCFIIPHLFEL